MSADVRRPEAPPSRRPDPVVWGRVGLWSLIGALALVLLTSGVRYTSYSRLVAALEAGEVTAVTISPGLPTDAAGAVTRQVRWRDGWIPRQTVVVESSPGEDTSEVAGHQVGDDAVRALREHAPDLRVTPASEDLAGWEGLGWSGPGWVVLLAVGAMVLTLVLITSGPKPWRAMRWAWFWMVWSPIGFVLFLVLAGPFPLRRERQPGRRFTGGWALLLSICLGALLPWS